MSDTTERLRIVVDPSGAKPGAREVEQALNGVSGAAARTETAVGKLKGAFVAMGGVFMASQAFHKFINETTQAQYASARMAAAVEATGYAAGRSVAQLQAHAAALQQVTRYADDAVQGAMARLLSFTSIQGDTFDRATRATLDFAEAYGVDLVLAAETVGKALEHPERATAALARQGYRFTEAQEAQIAAMLEAGRVAEAQAVVLEELEAATLGTAEAMRDTLGGALEYVRNQFGDLFEAQGDTSGLVSVLNQIGDALPAVGRQIGTVLRAMQAAAIATALAVGTQLVAAFVASARAAHAKMAATQALQRVQVARLATSVAEAKAEAEAAAIMAWDARGRMQLAAATGVLEARTKAYTAAVAQLGITSRVTAASMTLLSRAAAWLTGPVGIAVTTFAAAFLLLRDNAQAAVQPMEDLRLVTDQLRASMSSMTKEQLEQRKAVSQSIATEARARLDALQAERDALKKPVASDYQTNRGGLGAGDAAGYARALAEYNRQLGELDQQIGHANMQLRVHEAAVTAAASAISNLDDETTATKQTLDDLLKIMRQQVDVAAAAQRSDALRTEGLALAAQLETRISELMQRTNLTLEQRVTLENLLADAIGVRNAEMERLAANARIEQNLLDFLGNRGPQGSRDLFSQPWDTEAPKPKKVELDAIQAAWEEAVRGVQRTFASGFDNIFDDGLAGFEQFTEAVVSLFRGAASEIASVMAVQALGIDTLLADLRKGVSLSDALDANPRARTALAGGAGLVAGSIIGSQTTNTTSGALGGAMGGAAIGAAIGGPAGAAAGAIAGLASGIMSAGKAAEDAHRRMNDFARGLNEALAEMRGDNVALQQIRTATQAARMRDEARDAFGSGSARDRERLYSEILPAIDEWEKWATERAKQDAEYAKQANIDAANLRVVRANGSAEEVERLGLEQRHRDEIHRANMEQWSEAERAALALAQTAEQAALAAEQAERKLRQQEDLNVRELFARAGASGGSTRHIEDYSFQIAQEREIANLRKEGASPHIIAQMERIHALEAEAREREWQQLNQQMREDYEVRRLMAEGRTEEAEALRLQIQHQREYQEAVLLGLDEATLAALRLTQAAEKSAQAAKKAEDAVDDNARMQQDLQVRLLSAAGYQDEADALRLRLQQQREYQDAVEQGLSSATLAAMTLAHAAEAAAQAAAIAERRLRTMEDLQIRAFDALGETRMSEGARLTAQHRRESQDMENMPAFIQRYLGWVQGIEREALAQRHAVEEAREAIEQASDAEMRALDEQLRAAQDLLSVSQDQLREQERTVDQLTRVVETLREFNDSLLLNDFSTLSPMDRLAEARRQFDEQLAAARGGDSEAAGQLPAAARALLEASRVVNASNAGYVADFEMVREAIGSVADQFDGRLSVEQQMLDALRQQVSMLEAQVEGLRAAREAVQQSARDQIDAISETGISLEEKMAEFVAQLEIERSAVLAETNAQLAALFEGGLLSQADRDLMFGNQQALLDALDAQIAAFVDGASMEEQYALAQIAELEQARFDANAAYTQQLRELAALGQVGTDQYNAIEQARSDSNQKFLDQIAQIRAGNDTSDLLLNEAQRQLAQIELMRNSLVTQQDQLNHLWFINQSMLSVSNYFTGGAFWHDMNTAMSAALGGTYTPPPPTQQQQGTVSVEVDLSSLEARLAAIESAVGHVASVTAAGATQVTGAVHGTTSAVADVENAVRENGGRLRL